MLKTRKTKLVIALVIAVSQAETTNKLHQTGNGSGVCFYLQLPKGIS